MEHPTNYGAAPLHFFSSFFHPFFILLLSLSSSLPLSLRYYCEKTGGVVSLADGKCIDVPTTPQLTLSSGTSLQTFRCHGGADQEWFFSTLGLQTAGQVH